MALKLHLICTEIATGLQVQFQIVVHARKTSPSGNRHKNFIKRTA